MDLNAESRPSDSPYVDLVWRAQSERPSAFISSAESRWEIVVMKYQGETSLTVRGPETRATPAECPADTEFFALVFKLGTFIPCLPINQRLDRNDITLPEATSQSFWLHGSAWQLPTYDNADTFVSKLVRQGLLVQDPLVDSVLKGQPQALTPRAIQYRFIQATGLTQRAIQQIKRAQQAAACLQQGASILDTVYETGYFDQPHLTRALKRYIGQTPTQVIQQAQASSFSLLYKTTAAASSML